MMLKLIRAFFENLSKNLQIFAAFLTPHVIYIATYCIKKNYCIKIYLK